MYVQIWNPKQASERGNEKTVNQEESNELISAFVPKASSERTS